MLLAFWIVILKRLVFNLSYIRTGVLNPIYDIRCLALSYCLAVGFRKTGQLIAYQMGQGIQIPANI